MPTLITFVIPSFNRAKGMIELIDSIYKQSHRDIEIIVVDDNSPDDSNERIEALFPDVLIIKNVENSGPAISRDIAIRASNGDIIIGLDSDVILEDTELCRKVIDCFLDDERISMLAFKLLNPDGTDDIQRWWHPKAIKSHSNKSFETDYFSGTGYAIRKNDYLKSGGFSHLIYMHYEEVLLSYRLIDCGGRIVYKPELKVIHNALPTTRRNKMKMFYKPRNQLILAVSCMPFIKGVSYVMPRLGKNLITAIRTGELNEYFGAISDFLQKRKKVISERKVLKDETFRYIKSLKD